MTCRNGGAAAIRPILLLLHRENVDKDVDRVFVLSASVWDAQYFFKFSRQKVEFDFDASVDAT